MFMTLATLGAVLMAGPQMRPPAAPLITIDPYFSIWSTSDELSADWPHHWTGTIHALQSMVRVDGTAYRIMGTMPKIDTVTQKSLTVLPTRTVYELAAGPVDLTLTFMTPALPDDLDVLSRPVGYITWRAVSRDGKQHQVQLYFDHSGELAVNETTQAIGWSKPSIPGLTTLRMGTTSQPVLAKKGDGLRIDWGYAYSATADPVQAAVLSHELARGTFVTDGKLGAETLTQPRACSDEWPVASFVFDLGKVGSRAVERRVMLAYDDLYGIEFLGRRLQGYWARNGMGAMELLTQAHSRFAELDGRAAKLDRELMADLTAAGGEKYAQICALAFRQCIAGHKLVADTDGSPLWFSKECYSNGCIATVDITYPTAPFPLLFSAKLTRALLEPIMKYAVTDRWKFPFAPHDIGTYPIANGQVYGGGERTEENQMPVEESGNLLIVVAALAEVEGNAKYAEAYWPTLTKWAEYLRDYGIDPGNQLCTDDFAGHLAHNTNLSMKAVVGLACYARLCEQLGKADEAKTWRGIAEAGVKTCLEKSADGGHYRLACDKPGTWSQKYNLVWDKLLGLKLFPAEVVTKEIAYYRTQLADYGLPLDNRSKYTKTDWEIWTATLADSRADWDAFIDPIWKFCNESPSRVPFTDWYWTHDAKQRGFQARPVIGGVFIKMLAEPKAWRKWAAK